MIVHWNRSRRLSPDGDEIEVSAFGFPAARATGEFVFVGARIGVDKDGILPATLEEQARLAFEAVNSTLRNAGTSLHNAVQMTTHHVGGVEAFASWIAEEKLALFRQPYPVWTAVGVTELEHPGVLLSVAAVARAKGVNDFWWGA